jgi:hypothetical protein
MRDELDNHGGDLLFTAYTYLSEPLIAPGGVPWFTINGSHGCDLVASYQLQAIS